ncbi:biopolymer transporter ExbB [Thioalkalivibrio denitrificans]|uniref:Biopolymer transport protein ExbB n=1 Tax=Thioalkalivibrio denitrificans TaxID=108003 RepID=A0A1V3N8S4_9GAMM|nr:MotA/TolQ/ExbB proton channel family protein [Thioalkalivibrio denitrificans]OOG21232.1 biopolymer transporter ExbB [Thioalkalivibrio denitrificans]
MDISLVFQEGDWVLIGVFLTLLLMSVATWALIIAKSASAWRIRRDNAAFQRGFWDARGDGQALAVAEASASPLAGIARAGIRGLNHYRSRDPRRLGDACSIDEFLVRTIRNALSREQAARQSGLTILASVGSTAPFVGLFGTVWGIYHALMDIAAAGHASMEVVAGPLGEALVATAAGLAAAIPAVLAYNAVNRFNRSLAEEMDGFAHDVHAYLTTGAVVAQQGGVTDTPAPRQVAAEPA